MRIWYIRINNKVEGPYSVSELKRDRRITPDTWVRKEGETAWLRIRDIPELKEFFNEDVTAFETPAQKNRHPTGAIAIQTNPPSFFFWWLVVAILITYLIFQFIWSR